MLTQLLQRWRYIQRMCDWSECPCLVVCDRTIRIVQPLHACTCRHSVLQCILVYPAVEEVSMQTIPCGVAHSVHPIFIVRKGLRVKEEFHEDRIHCHRMGLRANTLIIIPNRGIGHLNQSQPRACYNRRCFTHVALMVGTIEGFPIPAGGEEHLRSQFLT